MGKKYFTVSFDDGLEQDKKLISLMNQYGIKGTFNLNSGCMGRQQWMLFAGNIGFSTVTDTKSLVARLFPHVPQNTIPADEIKQVYQGHEVATHSVNHVDLSLQQELENDKRRLSELVGYEVCGHAYPFGSFNDKVISGLTKAGITYARTVKSTRSFRFPENKFVLNHTCWCIDKNLFQLLDEFIDADPQEDMLFYLWGHGYELDFNTKNSSWTRIETVFEKIAKQDDIVFCTNREALSR